MKSLLSRTAMAFATLSLLTGASGAFGQAWPSKTVSVVIPSTPGDGADTAGRAISAKLQQRLGQSFVIENKPGAGAIIASEFVKNAPPDGYTFIIATAGSHGINAAVYSKLPYHPLRDFEPVFLINKAPNVCVVNPKVPAKTMQEFVALAKSAPGKFAFSSGGNGSSGHMTGEYLKMAAGIDMLHVPYKGAVPALTDVVAGHAQIFCGNLPPTMPFIKSGQVRALAVTSLTRNRELPDVPSVSESGYPGFETVAWFGYFAPKGTPAAIISKFNAELVEVLKMPDVRQLLLSQGTDPVGGTPDEFRRYVEGEIEKWTKVARAANVRID